MISEWKSSKVSTRSSIMQRSISSRNVIFSLKKNARGNFRDCVYFTILLPDNERIGFFYQHYLQDHLDNGSF